MLDFLDRMAGLHDGFGGTLIGKEGRDWLDFI
jgi:hypothetical protein